MKLKHHLMTTILAFTLALITGAFAYHFVEGWGIFDSFYFVVVTVTTIGYGDFFPVTSAGKIITMFFAFFGVATALYILSKVSSSIFRKDVGEKVSELKRDVRKEDEIKEEVKATIRKAIRKNKPKR